MAQHPTSCCRPDQPARERWSELCSGDRRAKACTGLTAVWDLPRPAHPASPYLFWLHFPIPFLMSGAGRATVTVPTLLVQGNRQVTA